MTHRSAMLLFPGFTALDAIGPYHALAALPGHEFSFVASCHQNHVREAA